MANPFKPLFSPPFHGFFQAGLVLYLELVNEIHA